MSGKRPNSSVSVGEVRIIIETLMDPIPPGDIRNEVVSGNRSLRAERQLRDAIDEDNSSLIAIVTSPC